jgi:hypothetical protein
LTSDEGEGLLPLVSFLASILDAPWKGGRQWGFPQRARDCTGSIFTRISVCSDKTVQA